MLVRSDDDAWATLTEMTRVLGFVADVATEAAGSTVAFGFSVETAPSETSDPLALPSEP